jgi:hypothetical protein
VTLDKNSLENGIIVIYLNIGYNIAIYLNVGKVDSSCKKHFSHSFEPNKGTKGPENHSLG